MIPRRTLLPLALLVGLSAFGGRASAQEAPKLVFEVYKDKAEAFRWRLKAANGAVLATAGQSYAALADAKNGVDAVKRAAGGKGKFEVFEDTKREHRWRLKAGNGQVVATSSEGYTAKADADAAVEKVKAGVAKAEVVGP